MESVIGANGKLYAFFNGPRQFQLKWFVAPERASKKHSLQSNN